jgi:hypothetical protein
MSVRNLKEVVIFWRGVLLGIISILSQMQIRSCLSSFQPVRVGEERGAPPPFHFYHNASREDTSWN